MILAQPRRCQDQPQAEAEQGRGLQLGLGVTFPGVALLPALPLGLLSVRLSCKIWIKMRIF